mmetsp:Transcript_23425/g.51686  ORF Transcript_23425/g.51686 Transcript_23425/m.51686 type:complete len:266 (-) Transcript_23425:1488-2285(-)
MGSMARQPRPPASANGTTVMQKAAARKRVGLGEKRRNRKRAKLLRPVEAGRDGRGVLHINAEGVRPEDGADLVVDIALRIGKEKTIGTGARTARMTADIDQRIGSEVATETETAIGTVAIGSVGHPAATTVGMTTESLEIETRVIERGEMLEMQTSRSVRERTRKLTQSQLQTKLKKLSKMRRRRGLLQGIEKMVLLRRRRPLNGRRHLWPCLKMVRMGRSKNQLPRRHQVMKRRRMQMRQRTTKSPRRRMMRRTATRKRAMVTT